MAEQRKRSLLVLDLGSLRNYVEVQDPLKAPSQQADLTELRDLVCLVFPAEKYGLLHSTDCLRAGWMSANLAENVLACQTFQP